MRERRMDRIGQKITGTTCMSHHFSLFSSSLGVSFSMVWLVNCWPFGVSWELLLGFVRLLEGKINAEKDDQK